MFVTYFHNVVPSPLDAFDRRLSRMTADLFARAMGYLAKNFVPTSLETILAQLSAGQPDPKAVAVTFDDAYYGVLAHALPVLQQFRIPATVFAVTHHAQKDSPPLHFDEIELAFRLTEKEKLDWDFIGESTVFQFDSLEGKIECMKRLKRKMKLLPEAERRGCHETLLQRLDTDRDLIHAHARTNDKWRTLNWEELARLQEGGVSIGAHTRSHRTLSKLEPAELEWEICGSRDDLKRNLGLENVSFAYPYGGIAHTEPDAPEVARAAGFSCAVTTVPGENQPATDLFRLHRFEFGEFYQMMKQKGS